MFQKNLPPERPLHAYLHFNTYKYGWARIRMIPTCVASAWCFGAWLEPINTNRKPHIQPPSITKTRHQNLYISLRLRPTDDSRLFIEFNIYYVYSVVVEAFSHINPKTQTTTLRNPRTRPTQKCELELDILGFVLMFISIISCCLVMEMWVDLSR